LYQLVNITGADTDTFLQGQLTQDITRLGEDLALGSAWCNPKGRVVVTMTMIRSDNGIDLLLPEDIAGQFLQRVSIYIMRADVKLALANDYLFVAAQSDRDLEILQQAGLAGTTAGACRRTGELRSVCICTNPRTIEVFGQADALRQLKLQKTLDTGQWRAELIRNGKVQIDAANSEKYTPHMLSLDLAGSVSFGKGCYPGQEVVARTEHRGRSRRRLARYECDASGHDVGDDLLDEQQIVGTVVNASGNDILAVTPVELHAKTLSLNNTAAHPVNLPWQP